MKTLPIIIIAATVACFQGCKSTDTAAQFESLIVSSREHLTDNQFDLAYKDAMEAMSLAECSKSDGQKAKCFCTLAAIDIAGSRDAQAWENCIEAEKCARNCGNDEYLAVALIIKAQVCMFSSQLSADEPGRDDEGLAYLAEAIPLCEAPGMEKYLFEAYSCSCQLFINKNRWNEKLDQTVYESAGEALAKAEAVAEKLDDDDITRKCMLVRFRYLRQGARYSEALRYCGEALARTDESDNLTRYQIYDQMTNLYAELDSTSQVLASHRNTVQTMVAYMMQKSDGKLKDIEADFAVERKNQQIKILWSRLYALFVSLLLAAAAMVLLIRRVKVTKARNVVLSTANEKLSRSNEVKDNLISFISPSMPSEGQTRKEALSDLSEQCLFINGEEQIREHCNKVLSDKNVPEDVAAFIGEMMVSRRKRADMYGISPRELQIIHLCRQGLSSAEIAVKLFISVNTVSTHKRNIYSKLEVSNTAEMISKSISLGIL